MISEDEAKKLGPSPRPSSQIPASAQGGPQGTNLCALSLLFVIVGIASIILGFVCASKFTTDYSGYWSRTDYSLVVLYIAGGVLTGLFNFALAVIVDACDKYRKNFKK